MKAWPANHQSSKPWQLAARCRPESPAWGGLAFLLAGLSGPLLCLVVVGC